MAVEEHPGGMDLLRPLGDRRQRILLVLDVLAVRPHRGRPCQDGQESPDSQGSANSPDHDSTRFHGGTFLSEDSFPGAVLFWCRTPRSTMARRS